MPLDEFAWRVRLARRRRASQRKFRAAAGVIVLAIAVLAWYLGYYIQRPAYALEQAAAALTAHDAEAFQRRVNINAVTAAGYDDLTYVLFSGDTHLKEKERNKSGKFYESIKDSVAGGMAQSILTAVGSGTWPTPEGVDPLKGRQLGIDFERFLERSQLRNSEVIKVGDFHVISRSATAPLSVRDRHTGIESTLTLSMEQAADGHWQITGIANYQQYLDAIAPRQNRDIADYIAATRDIVAAGNDELAALKARFRAITKNAGGKLEGASASELTSLISGEIIPALKERQRKLDTVSIPLGAQYLANLRHTSTELAIAAWQHYQRAVETQSVNEFNTAETLKKQEIETDLRITDIIRHNVVSQSLPNIP